MYVTKLVQKKRDGHELSADDVHMLIRDYAKGKVPDYKMAAFLMAVYFQGMTEQELAAFTMAIVASGEQLAFDDIPGQIVDKHSTGGVGDTTTLILVPLLAACGVPVVKMSGRGLGHTGGTIDKLEAIPNFRTDLTRQEMINTVLSVGACITGQTDTLTPADKKLYALRDVTATVESIPLIAASIMSKKIASGADALVLDVKWGSGAFMKTVEHAEQLARHMLAIGQHVGKDVSAYITNMDAPLGYAIGNALEVKEAIHVLRGEGPTDLHNLVTALGREMLLLAGKTREHEEAETMLQHAIQRGHALEKLQHIVTAQGGNAAVVDDVSLLPQAPVVRPITAQRSGYVQHVASHVLGEAAMHLGAGRAKPKDVIDLSVGIEWRMQIGQHVAKGDTIGYVHAQSERDVKRALHQLHTAYTVDAKPTPTTPLIHKRLASS